MNMSNPIVNADDAATRARQNLRVVSQAESVDLAPEEVHPGEQVPDDYFSKMSTTAINIVKHTQTRLEEIIANINQVTSDYERMMGELKQKKAETEKVLRGFEAAEQIINAPPSDAVSVDSPADRKKRPYNPRTRKHPK